MAIEEAKETKAIDEENDEIFQVRRLSREMQQTNNKAKQ